MTDLRSAAPIYTPTIRNFQWAYCFRELRYEFPGFVTLPYVTLMINDYPHRRKDITCNL